LDAPSQATLHEFLTHGKAVRAERKRAEKAGETPDLIALIRAWGGVTIVYRRTMQESPAYITNHEELEQALEEGIYYLENWQPKAAILDEVGQVKSVEFDWNAAEPDSSTVRTPTRIPARTVLVATGAQLNIAYAFEHADVFKRDGMQYKQHEWKDNTLVPITQATHVKQAAIGLFTSYQKNNKYVTFIGDSHPTFHGSVVKAIASGQRAYPKILELFEGSLKSKNNPASHQTFKQHIQTAFTSTLLDVTACTKQITELTIHSPLAVQKYQPGEFFRFQTFETLPTHPLEKQPAFIPEALPLLAFDADLNAGTLKLFLPKTSASAQFYATLKSGIRVSLMGPTGVRTKIPDNHSTILIIGDIKSLAYVRAVGPALRAAGNRVIYAGHFNDSDALYCQKAIEACSDVCIWNTQNRANLMTQNRPQDLSLSGDIISALLAFAKQDSDDTLAQVDRISIIGHRDLLRTCRQAFQSELKPYFSKKSPRLFASAYAPMQCMLKGVCAQCLQWQIDPETGQRTKAVFTCSWQDQPLELIDIDNLEQRQMQNRLSQTINRLYVSST